MRLDLETVENSILLHSTLLFILVSNNFLGFIEMGDTAECGELD